MLLPQLFGGPLQAGDLAGFFGGHSLLDASDAYEPSGAPPMHPTVFHHIGNLPHHIGDVPHHIGNLPNCDGAVHDIGISDLQQLHELSDTEKIKLYDWFIAQLAKQGGDAISIGLSHKQPRETVALINQVHPKSPEDDFSRTYSYSNHNGHEEVHVAEKHCHLGRCQTNSEDFFPEAGRPGQSTDEHLGDSSSASASARAEQNTNEQFEDDVPSGPGTTQNSESQLDPVRETINGTSVPAYSKVMGTPFVARAIWPSWPNDSQVHDFLNSSTTSSQMSAQDVGVTGGCHAPFAAKPFHDNDINQFLMMQPKAKEPTAKVAGFTTADSYKSAANTLNNAYQWITRGTGISSKPIEQNENAASTNHVQSHTQGSSRVMMFSNRNGTIDIQEKNTRCQDGHCDTVSTHRRVRPEDERQHVASTDQHDKASQGDPKQAFLLRDSPPKLKEQ